MQQLFDMSQNNEHVYSHKAAQKKKKKRTAQKTAIYSLAYVECQRCCHNPYQARLQLTKFTSKMTARV